jgi:stearoyl-CoA desaturase (delta-9 desaturase)
VVRFQHRHYVPIALFSGLVLPWAIAHLGWSDGLGGLVWGGAVARLLIWYVAPTGTKSKLIDRHTTFCINSLAHWTGLQPYTEEVSAKGNYVS